MSIHKVEGQHPCTVEALGPRAAAAANPSSLKSHSLPAKSPPKPTKESTARRSPQAISHCTHIGEQAVRSTIRQAKHRSRPPRRSTVHRNSRVEHNPQCHTQTMECQEAGRQSHGDHQLPASEVTGHACKAVFERPGPRIPHLSPHINMKVGNEVHIELVEHKVSSRRRPPKAKSNHGDHNQEEFAPRPGRLGPGRSTLAPDDSPVLS